MTKKPSVLNLTLCLGFHLISAVSEGADLMDAVRISEKMNSAINELLEAPAAACLPSCDLAPVRSVIPQAMLVQEFAKWIRDPELRMAQAGESCLDRAHLLAAQLYRLGFRSTVMAMASPVIVALPRDPSGIFRKEYYPYTEHFVISVWAGPEDKPTEFILDPQFMNSPVEADKYRLETTGQLCQERPGKFESGDLAHSAMGYCGYEYFPGNWIGGDLESRARRRLECDWSHEKEVRARVQSEIRAPSQVGKPAPIPSEFADITDPRPKLLILRYQRTLETVKDLKSRLEQAQKEARQIPDQRSPERERVLDSQTRESEASIKHLENLIQGFQNQVTN